MTRSPITPTDLQEIRPRDVQRSLHANEFYVRIFAENGLPIVSWHNFSSWKEFVDGNISESQLSDQAKSDMQELAKSFGKFFFVDKNEERRRLDEEKEKRERAKQANRIYRKACQDAGLEVSFFQDFVSWSDYVEGKIDEEEFYDRVRAEVRQVLAGSHGKQ